MFSCFCRQIRPDHLKKNDYLEKDIKNPHWATLYAGNSVLKAPFSLIGDMSFPDPALNEREGIIAAGGPSVCERGGRGAILG